MRPVTPPTPSFSGKKLHPMKTKILAPLAAILLCAFAHAGTVTWTGDAGTSDYATADNWDPSGVPAETDDVIIDGVAVTKSGNQRIPNSLTLRNGASLTLDNGEIQFGNNGVENPIIYGGTVSGNLIAAQYNATLTISDATIIDTDTGNFHGFYQNSGSYLNFVDGAARAAKFTYQTSITADPYWFFSNSATPFIRYDDQILSQAAFNENFQYVHNQDGTTTLSMKPLAGWKLSPLSVGEVANGTVSVSVTATKNSGDDSATVYFAQGNHDYGESFAAWPSKTAGVELSVSGTVSDTLALADGNNCIRAFLLCDGVYTASAPVFRRILSYGDYGALTDVYEYIGTDKKSVSDIKLDFYKLACSYSVSVNNFYTTVSLSGLSENMPAALALLEDLLQNAKADPEAYSQLVDLMMKSRTDAKKNQSSNFSALRNYVTYGTYNPQLNILSEAQLRAADPQKFLDLLGNLKNYEQTVLYYGPMSEKELSKVIGKHHKTPKRLLPVPAGREYMEQLTPTNEVYIAPYEAKNIYMMQYHNEGKRFNLDEAPVRVLFNEYFGGGMNTIVFQELRESRGLAYSASASYSTPFRLNHPESFMTYIVSQNDKMMDCINTFKSIIDTIPQSQTAFDIAKQSAMKSLQTARTTKYSILTSYYWAKKRGFDFDLNERIYNALPSVTLQDIVDFERKNMVGKTYKYFILGDEKELDMKALEKIGPIHRLTTEEIFGY